MRDRWYLLSCLAAIVLATVVSSGWSAAVKPTAEKPAAAQTPRVPRSVRVDRCTVKLLEEVVLAFERPGTLSVLAVREGDEVEEGQLLARLKDDVARAALAVAEIEASSDVDIRYAQLAGGVAELEYERMQEANSRVKGTVADVEVRKARLAADKTVLEVEKATHTREVHMAKRDEAAVQLATYRMDAPFEGFVTRVSLSRGASVRQGDPVIELVSTKRVKVEGFVAISDLPDVKPGSKVSVVLESTEAPPDAMGRSFPGKIVFVDVKSVPLLHQVRVWAEVENLENALRAGLTPKMTVLPPAND